MKAKRASSLGLYFDGLWGRAFSDRSKSPPVTTDFCIQTRSEALRAAGNSNPGRSHMSLAVASPETSLDRLNPPTRIVGEIVSRRCKGHGAEC